MRRSVTSRLAVLGALGIVVAIGASACSSSAVKSAPTTIAPATTTTVPPSTTIAPQLDAIDTVVLVGDSLAQQASSFLKVLEPNRTFVAKYFGGTAPCDWLSTPIDASPTSVVVISFTGNSLTGCMSDGAGGYLTGVAMIDKYRSDVTQLISEVRDQGAAVVLVEQPEEAPNVADRDKVDAINDVYLSLSAAPFVSIVDAGAAVEAPDGTFVHSLPCVSYEPKCAKSGSNVVRSDDGRHFCPGTYTNPCPVYSSGAFRFAYAIAKAVNDPAAYEDPPTGPTLGS